jgi:dienelactone hydrolase
MAMKKVCAFLAILAVFTACPGVGAAEDVSFKSSLEDVTLKGVLIKPGGRGPFPAAVLLHGCSGATKRDAEWAELLKSWGYASLRVDSFRPRGISRVCSDRDLSRDMARKRIRDAYDARAYLSQRPDIDGGRILVMGWSHGGGVILNALAAKNEKPFRAAVAFYPYCDPNMEALNAPLLILIGERDDWTPAQRCVERTPPPGSSRLEVSLRVYPGAYHGFDHDGSNGQVLGFGRIHRILYDSEAAADARRQVRAFIGRHDR